MVSHLPIPQLFLFYCKKNAVHILTFSDIFLTQYNTFSPSGMLFAFGKNLSGMPDPEVKPQQ